MRKMYENKEMKKYMQRFSLWMLRTFSVLLLLYLYSLFLTFTNIRVPENECTGVG